LEQASSLLLRDSQAYFDNGHLKIFCAGPGVKELIGCIKRLLFIEQCDYISQKNETKP